MPSELNLTRTFLLISGIINSVFAAGWIIYLPFIGIFTCGIGCLFGILPVLNIICAIMDFIGYNRLTRLNTSGTYSAIQFASIFEIITFLSGNPVSGIFGIINIINLNNENVKNYLVNKGIY